MRSIALTIGGVSVALLLSACTAMNQPTPEVLIPGVAPVGQAPQVISQRPLSVQPQPVTVRQNVQVASFAAPAAASAATALDGSIITSADSKLSGSQIKGLLAGRTLLSQRLTDPSDKQVGTFFASGQMNVVAGGQSVVGNWEIEGDSVCYLLSGSKFCSTLHQSAKSYNGQQLYYFRRANGNVGEPTVVVYSIQ